MKHVIAFDVSMGKSYMVMYNPRKTCEMEREIKHTRPEFLKLKRIIDDITDGYGEQPHVVFESTGVYSRQLERFMQDNDYSYCLLNPLESKIQCHSLRIHKTDRSDAHQLALTHFTNERREHASENHVHRQLKRLSRYYAELDNELNVNRSRLHKVIQETFPELEQIFTFKSALFLNIAQLYPHPELVRRLVPRARSVGRRARSGARGRGCRAALHGRAEARRDRDPGRRLPVGGGVACEPRPD
jgi:transposase